jgi:hypothetical protein
MYIHLDFTVMINFLHFKSFFSINLVHIYEAIDYGYLFNSKTTT